MEVSNIDAWIRMYEEELRFARHHETLRYQATNIIVVISGVILAYLASDSPSVTSVTFFLLLGFVFLLNLNGVALTIKHYERSRRHMRIAREFRKSISNAARLEEKNICKTREDALDKHRKKFKRLHKWRTYMIWTVIPFLVTLLMWVLICIFAWNRFN